MIDNNINPILSICISLFSNQKLISLNENDSIYTNENYLESICFYEFYKHHSYIPDHVFKNAWKSLKYDKNFSSIFFASFDKLTDYFLKEKNSNIYIKNEKYSSWSQIVTSNISGIFFQAYFAVKYKVNIINFNLILKPFDLLVQSYIEDNGLNETHLHLNGSSFAEHCWLYALKNPMQEVETFSQLLKTNNYKVNQLFDQVYENLTPSTLFHFYKKAAEIRLLLINYAHDDTDDFNKSNYIIDGVVHLKKNIEHIAFNLSDVSIEFKWLVKLFKKLENLKNLNNKIYHYFHQYILIKNLFYKILVQNNNQFGFDQFQKITLTDFRENYEKNYKTRFISMHGNSRKFSELNFLEGRFAPKATVKKNVNILYNILYGYSLYLDIPNSYTHKFGNFTNLLTTLNDYFKNNSVGRTKHKLTLVPHFIKKPWSKNITCNTIGTYPFHEVRNNLMEISTVLKQTLDSYPLLSHWIKGIDAASNELDAPPEIFSPVFRFCKTFNLSNKSFHVGEDFHHLIGGIRVMCDAIDFLALRDGDRIGHGTAMGIDPQLWIDRSPETIFLKHGDWLLDLICARTLLSDYNNIDTILYKLDNEIVKNSRYIFGENYSSNLLTSVFSYRYIDPKYLYKVYLNEYLKISDEKEFYFSDFIQSEYDLAHDLFINKHNEFSILFKWYFDKKLWERSAKLVEVKSTFLDTDSYIKMQQTLMKKVSSSNIIIEVLPTSNVRISQYISFDEHHIFRWMQLENYKKLDDPDIMISLGSDDPGIFATDLVGEFYQVYNVLRNKGLSDNEALNKLAAVNNRGKVYRFHSKLLT